MLQKDSLKQDLFVITGPTAIGKSNIAIDIASEFDREIIGADSMQIYKRLDIGTGKVTKEEMRGIKHHMIDIIEPQEEYSVGQYVQDVEQILPKFDKLPIIVGGTGLYITSLINGSDFGYTGKNDKIREKWKEIAQKEGNDYVYRYLCDIDGESAKTINQNDIKRVIRAIEIYEITGTPKSQLVSENTAKYNATVVVLFDDDRDNLYKRINQRVDNMFAGGLVDEVNSLIDFEQCQSMQAIGYKEVIRYLHNEITLQEAKEQIKQASRNYAKRQMTFFKGMRVANKIFVKYDDYTAIRDIFRQI